MRPLDFPTVGRPLIYKISHDEQYASVQRFVQANAPPGELLVMWWLLKVAHYELFRDFYYQADALGGRSGRGFVIDFLIIRDQPRPLALEVQGTAFHEDFVHGEPVAIHVYDKIRRQVLEANGYATVQVSDVKLDQALDSTMRRALQGIDVL